MGFLGLWAQVLPEKSASRGRARPVARAHRRLARLSGGGLRAVPRARWAPQLRPPPGAPKACRAFPGWGPKPGPGAELVKLQCLEKMSVYAVATNSIKERRYVLH